MIEKLYSYALLAYACCCGACDTVKKNSAAIAAVGVALLTANAGYSQDGGVTIPTFNLDFTGMIDAITEYIGTWMPALVILAIGLLCVRAVLRWFARGTAK